MRVLKSGEIRYKPSAYKESSRLDAQPQPMKLYPRGSSVKIYLGCGWAVGYVLSSDTTRCCVSLKKERRSVVCVDNRNIQSYVEER